MQILLHDFVTKKSITLYPYILLHDFKKLAFNADIFIA